MGDPNPFAFDGGPVGCLLIHGFTGAPAEMRMLGAYLHAQGMTVHGPLLPGHGTTPEEMAQCRWQDWAEHCLVAYRRLRAQCEAVFVGGLSMGALLSAYVASEVDGLAGLMLYSPALKASNWMLPLAAVAKYVMPMNRPPEGTDLTDPEAPGRLWHYPTRPTAAAAELYRLQRLVKRRLSAITVPSLVVYSTRDRSIHAQSGPRTFEGLGARAKELLVLHNSGHCLTVDSEREQVFARSYGFIVKHTGPGAGAA